MSLRPICEKRFFLGESSLWDPGRNCWFFVNIFAGELYQYDADAGRLKVHTFDSFVSAVLLNRDGRLVVVTQKGIGLYDVEEQEYQIMVHPNAPYENMTRYNDCKCDCSGRLYAGTMDLQGRPGLGKVYRILPDWTWETVMDGVDYSNGIVWDTEHMYYTDTYSGHVYRYSYDSKTGAFHGKHILCTFPTGQPDGMSMDDEGYLWIALWGGHGLACVDPESGELLRKVTLSAPNVSSICFGGPDRAQVLVTTAQKDLSEEELHRYPHAGMTYSGELGVPGRAFYPCRF